jgi:hypothetical protein
MPIQKFCLFVTGMRFSGASTVSGMLATAGVDFGKTWIKPSGDSPKDHHANRHIGDCNEAILNEWGISWDSPLCLGGEWVLQKQHSDSSLTRIKECIVAEFGGSTFFVIQDPRLGALLPLWVEACMQLDIQAGFVVSLRHPAEVAGILREQYRFSRSKSLAIWLNHCLGVERMTRTHPRLFTLFEDVVAHPKTILDDILETFAPAGGANSKIAEEHEAMITSPPAHADSEDLGDTCLESLAVKSYKVFQRLSGREAMTEDDLALLDSLFDRHQVMCRSFFVEESKQLSSFPHESAEPRDESALLAKEMDQLRWELRQAQHDKYSIASRLTQTQQALERALSEIAAMKSTFVWRNAERIRRLKKRPAKPAPIEAVPEKAAVVNLTHGTCPITEITIQLRETTNNQSGEGEAWLLDLFDEAGDSIVDWQRSDLPASIERKELEPGRNAILFSSLSQLRLAVHPHGELLFLCHPWSCSIELSSGELALLIDLSSPVSRHLRVAVPDLMQNESERLGRFSDNQRQWLERMQKSSRTVVSIVNPDWRGVRSAAENLVADPLLIEDNLNAVSARRVAHLLCQSGAKQFFVGGFPISYEPVLTQLKKCKPEAITTVFWLSSFLQSNEDYTWYALRRLHNLNKKGIIDTIAMAKKGMAEVFTKIGGNAEFLPSYVNRIPEKAGTRRNGDIHIGIWALAPIWRKSPYAMLAATALLEGVTVHLVGQDSRALEFARFFDINVEYREAPLPQDEMPQALAAMDLNLYVTLSECCPMLPLESLSVGVPCLFGPNSHLFEDHDYLYSRLVVPYPDRSDVIHKMIIVALRERERIVDEYRSYAKAYNASAQAAFTALGRGAGDGR